MKQNKTGIDKIALTLLVFAMAEIVMGGIIISISNYNANEVGKVSQRQSVILDKIDLALFRIENVTKEDANFNIMMLNNMTSHIEKIEDMVRGNITET